jgi:hypothetical protein
MVTIRRVDFEKLMIEIPEDTSQPIVVNWLDNKGAIFDSFKVESENEESFESFMKELFLQGEKEEFIKKLLNMQGSKYVIVPMRWFRELGQPEYVKLRFDKVNKRIEIEVGR